MAERCGNKQKDNEVETMICPIEYVRKCGKKDGTKVLEKREKKAERGDRRRLRYWSFAQWLGSGCVGRLSGSVFKDCFHIRMRWWGSVKGGSESSMGSTRRVPLITSS